MDCIAITALVLVPLFAMGTIDKGLFGLQARDFLRNRIHLHLSPLTTHLTMCVGGTLLGMGLLTFALYLAVATKVYYKIKKDTISDQEMRDFKLILNSEHDVIRAVNKDSIVFLRQEGWMTVRSYRALDMRYSINGSYQKRLLELCSIPGAFQDQHNYFGYVREVSVQKARERLKNRAVQVAPGPAIREVAFGPRPPAIPRPGPHAPGMPRPPATPRPPPGAPGMPRPPLDQRSAAAPQ